MARPKKIERFKITDFKNQSGTKSWRVSGTKLDGTRVRENFQDQTSAIERKAELETEASGAVVRQSLKKTHLTPEQISDAEAASKIVSDEPVSLVASHYTKLRERAAKMGISLDEALRFAESRYRPEAIEISILEAKDKFIASRSQLRPKSKRFYEYSMGLLLKLGANKPVHTVSVLDLEKVLAKFKNPSSQRTYRRGISVFFGWAVRHHYCAENPCLRLDKLPQDRSTISILSIEEVKRLLTASIKYANGELVSWIAIALFAGLRPSEIEDLQKSDITGNKIRVGGGKLRRKLNRVVPIPENLVQWLQRFPFKGKPRGLESRFKTLKKVTNAARWVQDILRHTSISFQMERDRNEPLTAFHNGTSVRMINLHYRDVIDDSKAVKAFWALTPKSLLVEKVEVKLPSRKTVKYPPDEKLAKMVMAISMVEIGRKLGASNNAVKKYCIKRHITLPTPHRYSRDSRKPAASGAIVAQHTA